MSANLAPAELARDEGIRMACATPLFAFLAQKISIRFDSAHLHVSSKAWIRLATQTIYINPKRVASAPEWQRILSQAFVAFGYGVVQARSPQTLWDLSVWVAAERFCTELKIGQLPGNMMCELPFLPSDGVEGLFRQFVADGVPKGLQAALGYLTQGQHTYIDSEAFSERPKYHFAQIPTPEVWRNLFAQGVAQSLEATLQLVSYQEAPVGKRFVAPNSSIQRARKYVMDHHPLLGALAASFEVVEALDECRLHDVAVAAINVTARKIWMNPLVCQKLEECTFVFAHELLHAGLNHASRRRARDPVLWNVACDFVINAWLIAMRVGTPPSLGLLYDARYEGQSAEDIYDDLASDLRRARKLMTMRGVGASDMLEGSEGVDPDNPFTDGDAYCRRALAQGLERLPNAARGLLPAGLVEEIRSLVQPPVPWDVKLAQWFDAYFPPPELKRTYARPSRRQSSTPDIPRASIGKPPEHLRISRVFGVVLDTSGSMGLTVLGKALGAMASYAMARDVYAVRLVCCDAQAYDLGWVEPDQLMHRFSLKGRGGTVLQPGMDFIERLMQKGDFPKDGPVLIVTDGECEPDLIVSMKHAFLLPEGRRLPFKSRCEVFYIS